MFNPKSEKQHVDIRAYNLVRTVLEGFRHGDPTAASTALRRLRGPAERAEKKAARPAPTKTKTEHDTALAAADAEFSIYVRTRDSVPFADGHRYGRCVTCGRRLLIGGGQDNCGHWEQRDRMGVRFHEFNGHLQCFMPCNSKSHGNGRKPEHEAAIRKLHPVAEGEVAWPERIKAIQTRNPRKKTVGELRQIAEEYRRKTREILQREANAA